MSRTRNSRPIDSNPALTEADPWIKTHSQEIEPERLHALGVITFYWRRCEMALTGLGGQVLPVDDVLSRAIYHDLGDRKIAEIILAAVSCDESLQPSRPLIEHVLERYDICRINRNQLTHFDVVWSARLHLSLSKGRSRGVAIDDDIADLREVAEQIALTTTILHDIRSAVRDGNAALLASRDRPPLPRRLDEQARRSQQ